MYIEYDKQTKKMALCYTYKVVAHTHSTKKMGGENGITTTQYIIPLNNTLKELTNIRKILFLYKNPNGKEICLTTQEPPKTIDYNLIRTYGTQRQTTIQLPTTLFPLNKEKNQTSIIKYYPQEEDPATHQKPLITLTIIDTEETTESTAKLLSEDVPQLQWEITDTIPEDLLPLLNEKQENQLLTINIHEKRPATVTYNLETGTIKIATKTR